MYSIKDNESPIDKIIIPVQRGIVGMTLLLIKMNIVSLVKGMNFRNILGLGLLASIAFTLSMFITSLAFTDELQIIQAQLGIFVASLIGGLTEYLVLKKTITNKYVYKKDWILF